MSALELVTKAEVEQVLVLVVSAIITAIYKLYQTAMSNRRRIEQIECGQCAHERAAAARAPTPPPPPPEPSRRAPTVRPPPADVPPAEPPTSPFL